jgi:hypothetical protein
MLFQNRWAYLGSPLRQSHSPMLFPSWASTGTFLKKWSKSLKKRRPSTKPPLGNGLHAPPIPWKMYKNSMENCYTPALWQLRAVLTSPIWKPCWKLSTSTPLFSTIHPKTLMTTYNGGPLCSALKSYLTKSLVFVTSQTVVHSQMPV